MDRVRTTSIEPRIVAVLLGAGLSLRLAWLWQINGGLTGFTGSGEATRVAMAIARGRGFADVYFTGSGPTAHLLPVNPGMAGLIMAAFGIDTPASNLALLGLALVQVGFAYVMLTRLFGRIGFDAVAVRWGLVALCLLPAFVQREVIDFRYWEGALAVGLAAASLAQLARYSRADQMTQRNKVAAALLAALTFFVSPTAGLAVMACWGLFSLLTESLRATLVSAAMLGLALSAFLGPWTVRNYNALGSAVLVRSNAGLEIALANYPAATNGRPTIETFQQRIIDIHPYHGVRARAAMIAAGGEVAYSHRLGEQAEQWIVANPARFAKLSLGHVRQLYFPEEWAYRLNESDAFNPQRSVLIALVSALGLLSLAWGLLTRRRGYAMLAVYVASVTTAYAFVQPITRYTYLLYPMLMFIAIDGVLRAARSVGRLQVSRVPAPAPGATDRQVA
jgi:hypothetical protein